MTEVVVPDRLAGLTREQRTQLFEKLHRRKKAAAAEARIPRRPAGVEPVPASFAQERLWFIDQLRPGNPAYNISAALGIGGELQAGALEAALSEVVRRHEALRTTFAQGPDGPVQVIAPAGRTPLPLVDLCSLPPETRRREMRRLAFHEGQWPFDLARGPLLRATLLWLEPAEHVLLLNVHHIVSDGWSMSLLVGETAALYGAALRGAPSPLPELPIQYPDFAVWQRGWLTGEVLAAQMDYWRRQLEGIPAAIDLPSDRPRPPAQTFRGARFSSFLGTGLARDLNALARGREATLYMVLLAALQAFLGRYTGQEDVVVGSPIANRNRTETASLIGFFVNSLALRGDLANDPTFEELIAQVRATALAAYQHQDLPFERLVEELRPERHLSHNPVFQVMFALQNTPEGRAELPGLSLAPVDFEVSTIQFDLEFNFDEDGGDLVLDVIYSTDLFDPPTARRLGSHLRSFLAEIARGPGRRISALPLASEAERHQVLAEWNDTARDAGGTSLLELVSRAAAMNPGAPAVVWSGGSLSYGELDRRANGLAHRLRELGVRPETPVAVLLPRSPELVLAALAVARAGGVYLPLDPTQPVERAATILADAVPGVALTVAALAARLPREIPAVLLLDAGQALEEDEPPEPLGGAGNLAYMIYTSGSTGRPKGVGVQRRSFSNLIAWHNRALAVTATDRTVMTMGPGFDASLLDLWSPLAAGAAVYVPDEETRLSPRRLAEWAAREGITVLGLPAPLANALLAEDLPPLPAVRLLYAGGDRLRRVPDGAGFPVFNLYGPTEATVEATSEPGIEREREDREPAIGRPIDNARVYLLDDRLQPVPLGVRGEMFLGGGILARGYLGRPGLTAESYLPDPFAGQPGARMYRTGDLARQRSDGRLEILGRLDGQVKVRGFRIETGEVEAALRGQPAVGQAFVNVRDGRLVAYVVPREDAGSAGCADEQISEWQSLYNEVYAGESRDAGAFDIRGWNSSYTGEPIPAEEMREWVEGTVARLLSLDHAQVLEVGCGTGLLLFRVAPGAGRYVGTDFSPAALELARREAERRGLVQVALERRTADDWSGVEPGSFDLVVINSVIQYFPGVDYLVRVLEGAARAVRPGGAVFVGDVRSLPLLEALHLSVELFRAEGSMPAAELRRRVRRRVADEEELLLHPDFFRALSRALPIQRADVLLKQGRHLNELTRFRYDVVLHVGEALTTPGPSSPNPSLPPSPGEEGRPLLEILETSVAAEVAAVDLLAGQELETVDDLRRAVAERSSRGPDPAALRALAGRLGYGEEAAPPPDLPWRAFANDPLRGRLARSLAPELRRALQTSLPEYMVPASFVFLDALPLTAHGKVDQAALPEPEAARAGTSAPPRTPAEKSMAAIWRDVLGVEEPGAEDDFFALGGHSLLATQLISRVREAFGVDLPLRRVFEEPTLAGFAAVVAAEAAAAPPARPPIPRRPADLDPVPASFAQERLWFLDRLEPGLSTYNMPLALRLRGAVTPALLEAMLGEVVRRHEALRTTFGERAGQPVQIVHPPEGWKLPVADLAGLPAEAAAGESRRLAAEDAVRPFDLRRGPLLRVALLRLRDEHVLLLTMHHIVSDGWSMGVLVREITALYGAALAGTPSPLPELPLQYADFAVWQRRWLEGEELERQLSYWRRQLAGVPASLDLPADRPRPAVPASEGDRVPVVLDPDLAGGLARLARGGGATLFMVLLAGFQTLLRRLTGQEDVPVGSPIANRNRAEIEPLIGYFVNTLVMRGDLAGDPTFRDLLARVRRTTLEAYAHQDLPFERLVLELNPERSLAQTPLFQVLFALQNAPVGTADLPGLCLEPVPLEATSAQFDLTLSLDEPREGVGEIAGEINYSTGLFHATTVTRLAEHLRALLAGAAADPDRRLSEIPLLSEAERAQVLREWSGSPWMGGGELLLHRLVLARAAADPDALAVIRAAGGSLTFGEFAGRAARLAGRLRRIGVGPEVRVGVAAGRSLEMVTGLLGVLMAGGAYVPLDPDLPSERLAWILEDSGAAALLADGPAVRTGGLPRMDLPLLLLENAGEEEEGDEPALPWTAPEAAAYVIYTSGSTGSPKGVVVSHRSAAIYVRGLIALQGLGPGDRSLQFGSLGFDVAVEEIWAPLASGATLVLRSEEMAGSVQHLLAELERLGVTSLPLPTAFWHELAAALERTGEGLSSSVRLVTIGGEALQPARLATWLQGGHVPVFNCYGPTETTVSATFAHLSSWEDGDAVPIGRPFGGARVYVVDRDLQPAPPGVWGELWIGGTGVARGYLGRPDLTAERFVPDPWSFEAGARVYRSGDRVRFLPGGDLEFGGRIDEQVKVRGFRIEPGEIEAVLASHPGLGDVAVVARRGAGGEASLLACVVAAAGAGEPSSTELRSFLAGRLPGHMVPAAFVVLPALPVTPNGKVDRQALARLAPDRGHGAGTPPGTPAEKAMAALWREVLEAGEVSLEDNFFELGGHSLLATQLVSRVRADFGVDLPVRRLFEQPTLGEIAALVAREAESPAAAATVPRRPPGTSPLPLSYAQERLWFVDRMQPGNPAYNLPEALRLQGDLSPGALAAALSEVGRRHEALRTTFQEGEGRPVQVIAPAAPVPLPLVDLSALAAGPREGETRRLAFEEAQWRFDLARGPLLRATLLRLEPAEHALLLNLHHIVSDGWSMGVLVGEITALYGAALQGRPSPLPEPPIQYPDFAVWQRGWLTGEVLAAQLSYWRRQLEGIPASIDLPADRPRPPVQSSRGARLRIGIGTGLTRELNALSRRRESTLFMTLLAAVQAFLGRYTGELDVVVGSPIANRNRAETAPLIGFFVNNLALRVDLSGDPAFGELIARARATALAAYEHQDLPFERLVEELRPERHLSHNPLFQVMFALQNAPTGRAGLPGLSLSPIGFEVPNAQIDLALNFFEDEDGLVLGIVYSTDLFDPSTMLRLGSHLRTMLAGAAADPGRRIGEIPLTPEAERHQVLLEWNDTLREDARVPLTQLAGSPDSPAVVWDGGTLSYGELDRRANALARRLRGLGVGPEVPAGVLLPRSPALVAAALAVARAGGVYLAIDPANPAERIATVLADAGAPVVLTTGGLAGALPPGVRVLLLDADGAMADVMMADVMADDAPLEPLGGPDNLAYIVYTSGSTGRPKGVGVERGALANLISWHNRALAVTGADRLVMTMGTGFDAALLDLWSPLAAGAAVHIPDEETRLSPRRLAEWAAREEVTVLGLPAPLANALLAEDLPPLPALRLLYAGGDRLRRVPAGAGFSVFNLYGPTEATVEATGEPVIEREREDREPAIGRPIDNARVYLLDDRLQPVPLGVRGEIFLGGGILARGYLGRPRLTAESYLPDPFAGRPGARMYRTGDLARQRSDGRLEILGRLDGQVKVRGFRIETGEVEAVLREHPQVGQAFVTVRPEADGGKRLVAWVVPGEGAVSAGMAGEQISQWQSLYDDIYGGEGSGESREGIFDIRGWNSSYTGQPIPAEEMREWVDDTVSRLLSLDHARVLEVGCGTGLLLFRVAPDAERYVGTDFSPAALDLVRREAARRGLAQVALERRTADDWSGVEPGSFDLVVINSVVQYFPGVDYLLRVLEGAARAVRPGGAVFLGDVRSLPLLEALHLSVELFRAEGSMPAAELRRRVRRRVADEEELLLDPAFFQALSRALPIQRADVLLKQGRHLNELTRFRYDVILHVGTPGTAGVPAGHSPDLEMLEARVASDVAAVDLLATAGQGLETVDDLRRAVAQRTSERLDPEALRALAGRLGYGVEAAPPPDRPWRAFANDPLRGKLARSLQPELRRALQARLPEYMVPSAFVFLDSLPLTPQGKVDQGALPAPEAGLARSGAEAAPPRTPLELSLAAIWRELLGVEEIGLDDNFFELGGHSLLATQLTSRVRASLGTDLPLRTLFESPTLGGLAAAVAGAQEAAASPARIPRRAPDAGPVPLSPAQERPWFLDRLLPGTSVFNMPAPLLLRGPLDPGVLDRAFREVRRRQGSLRTRFEEREGTPFQVIDPPGPWRLPRVDLNGLPGPRRRPEAERLAAEDAGRPFDLERGPLFRPCLVRLADDEHLLLLTCHHIISDGWSAGVLIRELTEHYAAFAAGAPPPLPEPPVQYADFALWQRERLHSPPLESQLAWWKENLAGAPPFLDLPLDRPRPAVQTYAGGEVSLRLPADLTAALRALGVAESASLYMILLAALALVLHRWSGQDEVVIGSAVAGRDRKEVEGLIGFFLNNLAMRMDLSGRPDCRGLLRRARRTALAAYAHQEVPFERVVQELGLERDPSRSPVFQVFLNMLNLPAVGGELPGGIAVEGWALGRVESKYDFTIYASEGDELALSLVYNRDLFDRGRMEELLRQLRSVLERMARDPETPAGAIPLAAPLGADGLLW